MSDESDWKSAASAADIGSQASDASKDALEKPSEKTRFKKGRSGNPKGRPPKHERAASRRQLRRDVIAEMEDPVTVSDGGKRQKVPYILALIRQMKYGALQRDFRSRNQLFGVYLQMLKENEEDNKDLLTAIKAAENYFVQNPDKLTPEAQEGLNQLRRQTRLDQGRKRKRSKSVLQE